MKRKIFLLTLAALLIWSMSAAGAATKPTDGKPQRERPANTVSDARLMEVNNPSGENAAILVGRSFAVYLVGNNNKYLPKGTQATLNFLYQSDNEKSYPVGYEPHSYIDDEGKLYADYVKTVTVGADGLVELNADDIATASEGKSIPSGDYDVFYTSLNDSIVGTLPVITVTAKN